MTAQRMQLGPFFDDGALCGAAKLYCYDAGTSAEKTIWDDAAQAQPIVQPFLSDANGVFNFFASGNNKFIIQKSDGTELHVLDNWSVTTTGGGATALALGSPVVTASSMDLGEAVGAHWTGSNNVSALSGSSPIYYAMADGSFTLIHSASLVMPDARNRKVLTGDVLFFINEGSGVFRLSGHMQTEGGWTGRMGTSVAASATLAIPTDGDVLDVSGGATVTAIGPARPGYRFRARFTGTGLNITHNATSMISPWGVDYHTIQNELIEFLSLDGVNWMFYSLNGPKEQTGETMTWNAPTPPRGGLAEDGTSYLRSDYPGLFATIGTTHGSVDGAHFNVPDSRGRTDIMKDGGANRITSASTNGANANTLGGVGGAQTHTLQISEIPAHTHTQEGNGTQTVAAGAISVSNAGSAATGSTGGGGAHSNTQPWIAKMKYIRF